MRKELKKKIDERYKSQAEFIRDFNFHAGTKENPEPLVSQILSSQLTGYRDISSGWEAAYTLFFKLKDEGRLSVEEIIRKVKV